MRSSGRVGYGAFSLGESQLAALTDYIDHQEEHHRHKSFQEEYLSFLEKHQIGYDQKYIWD